MALVWGEGPVAFQQQQRHLSPRVVSIYSHDLYGPLQLKTIVYLISPFLLIALVRQKPGSR